MHALSTDRIVRVWETGQRLLPIDRALAMLSAALPEWAPETLDTLHLGEEQTLLFRLHSLTFGSELEGVVDCAECGETLEFTLDLAPLASRPSADMAKEVELRVGEFELRIRPLIVGDVRAAAGCADQEVARRLLGERSVVSAMVDGEEVQPMRLPESVISRIGAELASVDARAEILVELNCSRCAAVVSRLLDPGELLWSEVRSLAGRLLEEVHTLASAYGWTEREVLAMSPVRRAAYLELVLG